MLFFGVAYDEFVIEALLFDWKVIAAGIVGAGSAAYFVVIGLIFSALLVYFAARSISGAMVFFPQRIGAFVGIGIVLVSLLLVMVLARGTLGTFPLAQRYAAATASMELNKLVMNGSFALFTAVENFATSAEITPATQEQGRVAFKDYFGTEPSNEPVFDQFYTSTPANPLVEEVKPHVFLGIVESLSSSFLDKEYTGSGQLSQRLMAHFEEDVWFSRFTPAHNFTQGSIANITGLNYPIISQSRHRRHSLDSAAAKVFKQKGYRTVYIYSGFESVRDGANYYLRQGFDEFIGANFLLKHYPDMPLNVWGGEDYYAFDYAKKLLQESDEPLFIVMHTLTNHPPYASPSLPWLDKDLEINDQMRDVNGSLPDEALRTYHYTSEVVGEFLDFVKQGVLSQKTLIALTGDHGIRGAKSTSDTELLTKAVPFYLYAPAQLKPSIAIDTDVLGSHRDILPTIYNLALSEARYLNLGNDLFSARDVSSEFAILHGQILTNEGYIYPGQDEAVRSYAEPDSFIYGNRQPLQDKEALNKAQAYLNAIDWLKRYQLQNK